MSNIFDRQIATALRLITKNGAPVTWTKPAASDPGADPWRDERTGMADIHTPVMLFFSVIDAGRGGTRGFLKTFIGGTDVPDINEIGFLAGDCGFIPDQTDILEQQDGSVREIVAIDKIAPNGAPIIYFVMVK